MLAAAAFASRNRILTATFTTASYSIRTTRVRYGYRISFNNRRSKTCSIFSIKGFLSDSSSSSSSPVTRPYLPQPNSNVDGRVLFSTSAKTSDGSRNQKPSSNVDGRVLFSTSAKTSDGSQNQKPASTVADLPPGGKVADTKILRTLASYLWMKDNFEFKARVVGALVLLVGAKALNVQVPFLFKLAVDWLSTATGNAGAVASNPTAMALFATPVAVLIGYGIARSGASAFNGILAYKFGAPFAWITSLSVAAYVTFTLTITQWRTKFRKAMNEADNDASTRAIDSLINYETVKYFNNEVYEADNYDKYLKRYEDAALKTQHSLALLNFGQNIIISAALSTAMVLCSHGIMNGTMTVGDLVMVNGLLFQLSLPLYFLGGVYRETIQGLVDMKSMFQLLEEKADIKDKEKAKPLRFNGGSIQFENVHFGYLSERKILDGISLVVPAGKTVAIVGTSGSG